MNDYDLFLTPSMECVAFEHGRTGPVTIGEEPIADFYDNYCHFCYPFNLTGQPAVSVPMGAAEHGLPVGLQIVGRRFEDVVVLRAAAAWKRLSPWSRVSPKPRPPLESVGAFASLQQGSGSVRVDPGDTAAAAGERIAFESDVAEIRRVLSPRDRELVVEYDRARRESDWLARNAKQRQRLSRCMLPQSRRIVSACSALNASNQSSTSLTLPFLTLKQINPVRASVAAHPVWGRSS